MSDQVQEKSTVKDGGLKKVSFKRVGAFIKECLPKGGKQIAGTVVIATGSAGFTACVSAIVSAVKKAKVGKKEKAVKKNN